MERFGIGDKASAQAIFVKDVPVSKMRIGGRFDVICIGKDGKEKWRDRAYNKVVNQGLQHALDVVLTGGTAVGTWYVGLTESAPTVVAGDLTSTHGFEELAAGTAYTGDRKAWVEGRTNQTVDNSSNKSTFTIDVDATTVGGALLNSEATGDTGVLFSAAAFSGGDKAADSGDKIIVTYTIVASDDTSS